MFIYIFTTYPLYSETFLQREQAVLDFFNKKRLLFSLWKGGVSQHNSKAQTEVFKLKTIIKLPVELIFWLYKKTTLLTYLFENIRSFKITYFENLLENILGFLFGILKARHLINTKFKGIHSAWLSAPSSSSITLSLLLNKPCSSGAHAYDIFQSKGDFLLKIKAVRSALLHTSTFDGLQRLHSEVFLHDKVNFIRRGLSSVLTKIKWKFMDRLNDYPVKLLSVGRLVEKKDYGFQIKLLLFLKYVGIKFKYTLIGKGLLKKKLCSKVTELGLSGDVNIISTLTFNRIKDFYKKADVFLFSGKVSTNGDRDGLPNVVPEAISFGLPAVVSYIGGLPEFLGYAPNGVLISLKKTSLWKKKIMYLLKYSKLYNKFRRNGYFWVVKNFNAYRNTGNLINKLKQHFKNYE